MSEGNPAAPARGAQQPHELFLFNLLFNHVLLFIASVSAPSFPFLVVTVPILSLAIMGYTLWKARRISRSVPLIYCHWQLAARRTLLFGAMWMVMGVFLGGIYLVAGGHPRPIHFAVAALAFLPSMIVFLTLLLMESESLQHARHGTLPRAALARCRLLSALSGAA